MLIFDSHLDLGLNGVDWNRDLRMAIEDIRVQEQSLCMTDKGRQTNTVSMPELKRAEVGVGVATLLARLEQPFNHPLGKSSPEACFAMCHAHLAYYRAMERSGWMKLIRTRAELEAHIRAYHKNPATTPFGYILSMECADGVLDPDNIREWFDHGLRAIGITHYGPNRYGGGTRSEVGLSVDALPLLKNIEQLGMALDMTHLSDRAFWQVTEIYGGRVLASHQNARKFCDWQRQFSDDQLKWVFSRRGVVGIAFDAIMLQPGWVRGVTKPLVTIERAVDNIDHMCQLAGNAKQVGIGSDLDGGYGNEQTPADLNTIYDLQKIPDILSKRGYNSDDIQGIMHGKLAEILFRSPTGVNLVMMQQPNPQRYVIVLFTSLAALWMYIDRVCLSTLADRMQVDLAFDDVQKSFMLGAFFLAYALFQLPTGSLADRFGPRLVLTACIAGWSLVTMATGFVQGFLGLLLVRLLLGVAESGAYPAAAGLVKNWALPTERGRFSSIVALGGRAGGAIAPFITAFLAIAFLGWGPSSWSSGEVNWRGVFVFFGLCGLAVAVLFWLIVRDRPADVELARRSEIRQPSRPIGERLKQLLSSRNMGMFALVQFATNLGWAPLVTLLPSYLNETFETPLQEIGTMQSTALLIGCVGMLLGGFVTDYLNLRLGSRWGRAIPVGSAMLGCMVCCLLVTQVDSAWNAILILGAMAFLVDLSNPSIWAFAQDVGGRTVGSALGWGNMWGNLGAFASPVVLTIIKNSAGWNAAFVLCAVFFASAAVCGFLLNASQVLDRPTPESRND